MTEIITTKTPHRWKQGESGNPKGRPQRNRILTEVLRLQGQAPIEVNGEIMTAQEVVAKAVWHLAAHGEVWLSGRRLTAESVNDWIAVVKWLYTHIEPPKLHEADNEPEMIVRVVREDYDSTVSQPTISETETEFEYPIVQLQANGD